MCYNDAQIDAGKMKRLRIASRRRITLLPKGEDFHDE